jgi:ABC-type sugar transport system ATPase subunit
LDELTNSLDQAGVQVLAKTVQTIAARGVAIVLVSHIMDDINAWYDRVFRLEGSTLTVVRSQRPRQWRVVLRRWDDITIFFSQGR